MDKRIVKMSALTSEQRALVQALIAADRAAKETKARLAENRHGEVWRGMV